MANNLLRSIGLVSAVALIPAATAALAAVDVSTYRELDQFMNVFERVRGEYVDKVDDKTLIKGAIDGMLASLDPHSSYLDARDFQNLKTQTDGAYGGLGLTVSMEDGAVKIITPTEDTPAFRAGLKAGDYITHLDNQLIYGGTLDEAVDKMRGKPGTAIRLTIVRPGRDKPFDVSLTREIIQLKPVKWEIKNGVGIVNINTFSKTTGEAVRAALTSIDKALGKQPLGYVVDLRSNPGGLLDQAIDVASEFLPRGQVVVSVKGRTEYSQPYVYKSTGSDPATLPLVILINRNTASASEIVAGAIQDHGRGLIVGETSFGKGLVQRIFQLPFNTGLTLTTARYYTPYGRSLQRDYSSGSIYDYYTRHDSTETAPAPGPRNLESPLALASPTPHPHTGPPVQTAVGRVFYGGGGITPDIEIKEPAATPVRLRIAEAAFHFTRPLAAGVVPGLESYKVDKVQYGKNPKASDFVISDRVLEAFRNYVRTHAENNLQPAQIDEELEFAKLRLRQEIITAAYSNDAGARVLLDNDAQVLRALEALPDAKRLADNARNGVWQG